MQRPPDMPRITRQSSRVTLPTACAIAMVTGALLLVTGAKLSGFVPERAAALSGVESSRLIRFDTATAGAITVRDATTGTTIATTGQEGFIPGVLRGLNRLRRTGSIDISTAYRLDKLDNGQLLLTDTATGVTLDLNAYGQDNAKIFNAFLTPKGENS